jgi:hypothetical protein
MNSVAKISSIQSNALVKYSCVNPNKAKATKIKKTKTDNIASNTDGTFEFQIYFS